MAGNTFGQRAATATIAIPEKPGTVTIPGHPSNDVAIGTELSIFKQAGLKRR
jgi:predicted RNA binding protein YcfA (HicA-like mRNA interferase family)